MTDLSRDPSPDQLEAAVIATWRPRLRAPIIAAPVFLISGPALVIAQSTAGVVGTFPSLNVRSLAQLDEWLGEITAALADWNRHHPDRPVAPFGVNLIVHRSNSRLDDDLALCVRHQVPLVISSMGARADANAAIQAYGGVTLHDLTSQAHAHNGIDKGASGLIAVAVGADGHGGQLSPFALVEELRTWFNGPLALAGAIASGRSVAAAIAAGADFAYVGSAFIATAESAASPAQKAAMIEASAEDIVYTPAFSGTPANYLRSSIVRAGLNPDTLPQTRRTPEVGGEREAARTWSEIWGSGHGVGSIRAVEPARVVVDRFVDEYQGAVARMVASRDREMAA